MVDATSSASSSTTKPSFAVSGLVSGIDSKAIVDAMIAAESAQKNVLEARKTLAEGKATAVRSLNTKLLSAGLDLSKLKQASTFSARTATSSNTAVVTAKASTSAQPGTYQFTIDRIATAHQVATVGRSSATNGLGASTIDLQVGSGPTTSITIDPAASSLNDIASAINASGAGVTAAVVNTGGANPFRLMLTSKTTGEDNRIIAVGTGGASTLFDNMDTLAEPENASIMLGTGTNAIEVTSASNTVTGVIPGVTLSLLDDSANSPITVSVSADTSGVKDAVKTFVTSINDAIKYLNDNSSYDTKTGQAGILFSESSIRRNASGVIRAMTSAVGASSVGTASAAGLTIDRSTNLLTFNESEFTAKLESDPEGVAKLFTNSAISSLPAVKFAALSAKTRVDQTFTVNISSAATQARALGNSDLDASTVIDSTNDTLDITINNSAYSLTLTHDTYDRAGLAAHIQSVLQGATGQGDQITVGLDGNKLDLRTKGYGSTMLIALANSNSLASLKLSNNTNVGSDVVATINDVAAVGRGQVISGAEGSDAEGLVLVASVTSATSGVTIKASKGLAQYADEAIKSLTDPEIGVNVNKTRGIEADIEAYTKSISKQDIRLEAKRKYLEGKFLTMEKTIASLQSQGNYLQGQINSWTNSTSKK